MSDLGGSFAEPNEAERIFQCTGVTARWCPNHGDCVCGGYGTDEWDDSSDMDDGDCPLHSHLSPHPREAVELFGDHVIPVEPDEFEVRMGVVYCRRCGWPMAREDGSITSKASQPCPRPRIGLRSTSGSPAVSDGES